LIDILLRRIGALEDGAGGHAAIVALTRILGAGIGHSARHVALGAADKTAVRLEAYRGLVVAAILVTAERWADLVHEVLLQELAVALADVLRGASAGPCLTAFAGLARVVRTLSRRVHLPVLTHTAEGRLRQAEGADGPTAFRDGASRSVAMNFFWMFHSVVVYRIAAGEAHTGLGETAHIFRAG